MSRDDWRPRLGFSTPSMSRACVRSVDFFQDLGPEIGEWWFRLASASAEANEDWRRIERTHLEEAAAELATAVAALLPPVREVVVRRAAGQSWRRISEALPTRAYFSLTDDWEVALRTLWGRHGDVIRRLV